MEAMTDSAQVARQYRSTSNLETRRNVWGPGPEGLSPVDVLRDAVLAAGRGRRILEIGCGAGLFARSVVDAGPGTEYVATDLSPAMVAATAALGVPAQRASADALPFPNESFDVVVAAWMLYHVPDLDAALREVRRVLRVGGTFCVATNGERHLAELLRDAGGEPVVTQFSSENATPTLRRHFADVTQRDIETRATFDDHAAATAYLATFSPTLAAALPVFDGRRQYAGHASVVTAR